MSLVVLFSFEFVSGVYGIDSIVEAVLLGMENLVIDDDDNDCLFMFSNR